MVTKYSSRGTWIDLNTSPISASFPSIRTVSLLFVNDSCLNANKAARSPILTISTCQKEMPGVVTKCLYPASNADCTAAAASPGPAFQVPNPIAGIFAPVFNANVLFRIPLAIVS